MLGSLPVLEWVGLSRDEAMLELILNLSIAE
jgi:hypothetical protein